MSSANKGLMLGLIGVTAFAISVPATKLATVAPGYAGLDPVLIAFGRAAVAGVLSTLYLLAMRAPVPNLRQIGQMLLTGLGIVVGWPLFLGLAVKDVESIHASVISGALPLSTAVLTALWLRKRASTAFWITAVAGFLLVLAFAYVSGEGGLRFSRADLFLLAAVLSASAGYVLGARLSAEMKPEHVISWILVFYCLPCAMVSSFYLPQGPVAPQAWAGFAYVSVFSMWLGFFAWYRALAIDPMRVSQVQLVQPFLSMLIAVPLLGEALTLTSVGFCLAIIATVAISRRVA